MRWRKRDYVGMALMILVPIGLVMSMDGYLLHVLLHETRGAVHVVNYLDGRYAHTVNHGATPSP